MSAEDTYDELLRKIKTLSERLWEDRCNLPNIETWLKNFDGRHCGDKDLEKLHALHLLASVSFFGLRELRVLLRAMYRDLFRYPIVQRLRQELGGSNDAEEIGRRFNEELLATRFVGMGNPAESGTHLLYYFRQENHLPKSLFMHQHQLLTSGVSDPHADLVDPSLKRVVFIDDLCGSGQQSVEYSEKILRDLGMVARRRSRTIEFQYLVLFGRSDGLDRAREHSAFDVVEAVSEMDSTYRTFGSASRIFSKKLDSIDKTISEQLAHGYGMELCPGYPLGYDDGQLLLAFHHNIPDNSLPILWYDENQPPWSPIFPRSPKIS